MAVSALVLAGTSLCADTVWLSSLDLSQMTSGWSVPKTNFGVVGTPIRIGGKEFARGVGTHAESRLRINIRGKARRFFAHVGVDDSAGGKGSVEFVVSGDGKVLWRSGILTGGKPAVPVEVSLAGVETLTLRVSDGGDGADSDHADWAEAGIEMEPHFAATALPPFEGIELKTKDFALSFEIGDDKRLYQQSVGATETNDSAHRFDEAYPQWGDGYVLEPALQVTHADGNTSTVLRYQGVERKTEAPGIELIRITLRDPAYPFQADLCFRTHQALDVIEQWVEFRHEEAKAVLLERMASSSLLLSPTNLWLTHFFGDWSAEMQPISEPLTPGLKVLDSKLGVRAAQFRNPSFVLSLDGRPTETSGRVLAGSLAWSGSFQLAFEHSGRSVRALCGVNPFASAYQLKPKETFATPAVIWAWSARGLGEMSRKLHSWARDFGIRDGHKPRNFLLTNWEATGFDYDFARIAGLFPAAKDLGAELFLLDDGWFGNKFPRTNDEAGLGDWQPNRRRFPNGLGPLAEAAVKQGLQFGIWVEPEMVNPKSDLFERHSDWVIAQPKRELELQRNQLALDLTRPKVQQFEWQVIGDILRVPGITYLKWDCNRYLTQPGSSWLAADRQSHLWIDYVRALYSLMDKTAKTFPDAELMLCSGGGGRADYGALRYFHEFWPSDNTDPVTCLTRQWDYSYFFPPMAICNHVTHTGQRPMHFACCVAMSARFGMDLDLAKLPADEKAVCAGAIRAYKHIRDVTHLGDLYRLERPHEAFRGALNFVSSDRSRAVLFVFQLRDSQALPVRPQGLDDGRHYMIRELNPAPGRPALSTEGKSMTGKDLMRDGIVPSCSQALEACVIELAP